MSKNILFIKLLVENTAKLMEPKLPDAIRLAKQLNSAIETLSPEAYRDGSEMAPLFEALLANRKLAKNLGIKISEYNDPEETAKAVKLKTEHGENRKDKLNVTIHVHGKINYIFEFNDGPNLVREITAKHIHRVNQQRNYGLN